MAEAQSFELLKSKRKSLRTAVTKVVNELEAELSNSDLNVDSLYTKLGGNFLARCVHDSRVVMVTKSRPELSSQKGSSSCAT
ncbi:hypothetical protein TNCV_3533821 [Trichonephila clavipes]|nr:hypothetical protein TNCV_3533821 [Trichonephila clavipes]